MLLTNAQQDYVETRRKQIREILDSGANKYLISYAAEFAALNVMVDVHNIEAELLNKAEQQRTRTKK